MKNRRYATTALILLAAGAAASQPAIGEASRPVMISFTHATAGAKLKLSTTRCVELAQQGRFEQALQYCNRAVERAEAGYAGTGPSAAFGIAAARSNRAVVNWLLRRDRRAAQDLSIAAVLSPEASFIRTNLAVMGLEPPAAILAGGNAS